MNRHTSTPGKMFLHEANRLCRSYFKEHQMSPLANSRWWTKFALILFVLISSYLLIILNPFTSIFLHILSMVFFNLVCMAFGLNIAHDASHNALFRSKKINYWFTKAFDFIGISGYVWTLRHVQSHHKYTNVPDMDADLAKQNIIRLSPSSKILSHHKFQVYYAILIYAHYTLLLVYVKDLIFLFSKDVGSEKGLKHPLRDVLITLFGKVLYTTYALIVPLLVLDIHPGWIVLAFYLSHLVTSITAFMLLFTTHFQDNTAFPSVNEKNKVNMDWAAHQLACTADFAPSSTLITWATGGLNLHLAHHLYPGICHIHYPAVTRIIKECASKHGLVYHANSWPLAIASHWRFLYRMGREEHPYCQE